MHVFLLVFLWYGGVSLPLPENLVVGKFDRWGMVTEACGQNAGLFIQIRGPGRREKALFFRAARPRRGRFNRTVTSHAVGLGLAAARRGALSRRRFASQKLLLAFAEPNVVGSCQSSRSTPYGLFLCVCLCV